MYLRTRAWFFCGSAILLPELRFWPVRRHNQYKRVTWLVDVQGQAEAQAGLMQQQRVRRAGGRGEGEEVMEELWQRARLQASGGTWPKSSEVG